MGEVYRATDTKLARDIALKVLPPEMASDPGRLTRFQREARAVAALNHPNVVTVYSVEESDNVHFITMELIEGQPLDRLISANGLPTDRIIEIASAVAEALAAAHEKGIVHRDLKPTAEEQVAAKAALKRAVEQSPNSSDCWAMLSILQTDGNIHGLDPAPDSLDDALQSAQRAVDIAPTNHKAYQALAWVRYFRKEFQPSQKAAERAIALNPMDGGALVYVGQTRLGARLLSRSACYGIESQPCRLVLVHAFPQCVSQERLPRGARLRSEDQHARLPAGVHRARGCSRSAGRNRRRPTRSARTADIATELRLAGTR
jgi:tetratricopeptide (TPR) repeat protein